MKTRRRSAWVLAGLVLGLAGCGGASKVGYVAPRTTQSSDPAAATTTSTGNAGRAKARTNKKSGARAKSAKASVPPNNGTQVNVADTHPTIPGVTPLQCLSRSGLIASRAAAEPGVWEANAPGSNLSDRNETIFVDGPYRTTKAAWLSANSLLGVEYAVQGGRYVVTASLPSHLSASVGKVGACLGGSSSSPAAQPQVGSGSSGPSSSGSSKTSPSKKTTKSRKTKSYSF